MVNTGTRYVVTIGRRYVRYPGEAIVSQQVEHAHDFENLKAALEARDFLKTKLKKEIKVFQVVVTEMP